MPDSFVMNVKQEMPPLIAKIYAAQVADGSGEVYERFVGELLSKISEPVNVLDVGCGPGHVCELLATRLRETQVIGVDLSDTLIGIAGRNRKELPNLTFEVGNALNLRFIDEEFDVAISVNSIKAWPDRQAGILQMTRVVRPGGKVIVFECDPDCSKEAAENFCSMWLWNIGLPGRLVAKLGRAWHFRRFVAGSGARHSELRGLMEEAGLSEIESFSYVELPFACAIGVKA